MPDSTNPSCEAVSRVREGFSGRNEGQAVGGVLCLPPNDLPRTSSCGRRPDNGDWIGPADNPVILQHLDQAPEPLQFRVELIDGKSPVPLDYGFQLGKRSAKLSNSVGQHRRCRPVRRAKVDRRRQAISERHRCLELLIKAGQLRPAETLSSAPCCSSLKDLRQVPCQLDENRPCDRCSLSPLPPHLHFPEKGGSADGRHRADGLGPRCIVSRRNWCGRQPNTKSNSHRDKDQYNRPQGRSLGALHRLVPRVAYEVIT